MINYNATQAIELKIGSRIRYCGNMANPRGEGAVVDIENGYATVALRDGRQQRIDPRLVVPEEMESGCYHPHVLLEGKAGGIEIAELIAGVATRKANESAKRDEATQRFMDEVARIKAKHPDLKVGGGAKTAAANCRKLLKAKFPDVKFSVRSGRATYSSTLHIRWTDGPTTKQVEDITGLFSAGDFDGMEDMYRHERTPWNETFGSAEYVSEHREVSAGLIQRAIDALVDEYAPCAEPAPSVEDYKAGRACMTSPIIGAGRHHDWQSLIGRKCAELEG